MAPPLLLLQDIQLSLGSAPLLRGAELGVGAGERICLVGRNGSGKSTLLKVAAGLLQADGGKRFIQPGATIRYLPQEPDFTGFSTVLDYVEAGMGPGDDPYRGQALLDRLGLSGDEDPSQLSGGQQRRAAIARTLAPAPDLLLLDEPTNHLDLPAIEWLEAELKSLRAGLVLISHDRRLLETLTRSIVWLDDGVTRRIDRGFAHYEAWREEIEAQAERDAHLLGRQILREEHWMRYGVTARRKRNVRRVGELQDLRQKRRDLGTAAAPLKLAATEADMSGKLVAVAENVSKGYGGTPIVRDLTLRVVRGDRLGIVGPNGAGKTTLLNLLTGRSEPDSGEIRIGSSLAAITLDQQRASLDPATTLSDTLTGGGGSDMVEVGGEKRHVIGYMKEFLFKPEQARTPVGVLSGGERGRLTLACAMARPSNLLVLDEPTNDLDLETLDLLQDMLAEYPGTVLLVSHDRDFLDRIVTSTLATEGDGTWIEYAGGYSDMLIQRGDPVTAPAEKTRSGSVQTGRTASRKLSFKDKHALEALPKKMETLTADRARLQARMADPDFYRKDPAAFAAANDQLAKVERDLATAEEKWLELEMMREALASS
ncbi:MAG: ATP-binding cassette domain-containing protein [Janthinobacterium lividum]